MATEEYADTYADVHTDIQQVDIHADDYAYMCADTRSDVYTYKYIHII
jgi:hypothetical protein